MQTPKQKTGALGELIARKHLETSGYVVEETGFIYRRAELDVIARAPDGTLVFVEVKTRRGEGFGHPTTAVSPKKERLMAKAAAAYMRRVDHEWAMRFDVIAIQLLRDGTYELEHFEDAFFPGLF